MIIKGNFVEAGRSLWASRQRTILAIIGIVIGIGSVIAMVSIGRIVQEEAMRQFREMGTDMLTIEKDFAVAEKGGIGLIKLSTKSFRLDTIRELATRCPGVALAAPQVQGGGNVSFLSKPLYEATLMGVDESFPVVHKLPVKKGRFLTVFDHQSRHCVIGCEIADRMRSIGAAKVIGSYLKVNENLFTVIGILDRIPRGGMRRFWPNVTVFVDISTGLRIFNNAEIDSITARVNSGTSNNQAISEVRSYFSAQAPGLGVRVISPEEIIAQMNKQMRMFTLLLGAIGSISLLVGGVGVMNVMLVSVTERRREIGIRRALGAKRSDIRSQFLIESLILSLLGGLFGIILGIGAAYLISHFAHWQFVLSINAIIIRVGVSNAVGIFFGFYPARQAAMLDPIVALR